MLSCKRFGVLTPFMIAVLLSPMPMAEAVELSHDGTGQVLFFPYFSANGGIQTLVSVRNISSPVAVRVRFRDGRTGDSALDLNVYLRRYDTWVAAVAVDEQTGSARLVIPADESTCALSSREDLSLGDIREGFIEVIKMGDLSAPDWTTTRCRGRGWKEPLPLGIATFWPTRGTTTASGPRPTANWT